MTDTTDQAQIHEQDTHAMTTTQLRDLYALATHLSQAAQAELVLRG